MEALAPYKNTNSKSNLDIHLTMIEILIKESVNPDQGLTDVQLVERYRQLLSAAVTEKSKKTTRVNSTEEEDPDDDEYENDSVGDEQEEEEDLLTSSESNSQYFLNFIRMI